MDAPATAGCLLGRPGCGRRLGVCEARRVQLHAVSEPVSRQRCSEAGPWTSARRLRGAERRSRPPRHAGGGLRRWRKPLILAAFCRRSPDSPVQQFSTSLDTRMSRIGLLAFLSACEVGNGGAGAGVGTGSGRRRQTKKGRQMHMTVESMPPPFSVRAAALSCKQRGEPAAARCLPPAATAKRLWGCRASAAPASPPCCQAPHSRYAEAAKAAPAAVRPPLAGHHAAGGTCRPRAAAYQGHGIDDIAGGSLQAAS